MVRLLEGFIQLRLTEGNRESMEILIRNREFFWYVSMSIVSRLISISMNEQYSSFQKHISIWLYRQVGSVFYQLFMRLFFICQSMRLRRLVNILESDETEPDATIPTNK